MSDSTTTFIILGGVVVLFVVNRIPVAIVAVATALSLWATGVLELEEATAGFGDPTVLFIASLFVVSEALDATGVTAWLGQVLVDRAGTERTRIVVAMMLMGGLLTALLTPNASVAALVPVVVVIAVRVGQPTSQLLIPLAFAAHAGALLALTGSPVNVLVAESADDAGVGRFGFFEFALVGVPLLIGTVAIVIALGPRLLPHRNAASMPRDLSGLDETLRRHYRVDGEEGGQLFGRRYGAAEVIIPPRSSAIGQRAHPGMVTSSGELVVVAVMRDDRRLDGPDTVLAAGDTLVVRGTWQALTDQIGDDDAVLAVDPPELVRRQAVPLGVGAREALAVLAVMVVLLATDLVPAAVAGLGAAGALVLLGVVPIDRAFGSIGWTTVVLVAGMDPALDGDADHRRGGHPGQPHRRPGRRLRALHAARRAVRADRRPRAADQQHGDGAHRDPDRPVRGGRARRRGGADPDEHRRGGGRRAAHADRHAGQPHGDGARRLRFGDYWKLGAVVLAWYLVIAVGLVPLIWRF